MPFECAVGEINLDVYVLPEYRHLFALRNGIRGNERAEGISFACLLEPRRNEIEIARALYALEHGFKVVFRVLRHRAGAVERRIAEDVVRARPVGRERVCADDVRGVLDRDAGEVLPEAVGDLHVAEVVHQPQRDLRDLGGERLDLDAVELRNRNLAELRDVEELFGVVPVKLLQHVHFEAAQLAVGDEEEVAASAGGVEERERRDLLVELLQPHLFLTQSRRGAEAAEFFGIFGRRIT